MLHMPKIENTVWTSIYEIRRLNNFSQQNCESVTSPLSACTDSGRIGGKAISYPGALSLSAWHTPIMNDLQTIHVVLFNMLKIIFADKNKIIETHI